MARRKFSTSSESVHVYQIARLRNSQQYPVFNLYAQAISLNKITCFGPGPSTTPEDRSFFGMRETIVGTNVTRPVFRSLHVSLTGEANGAIRRYTWKPWTGKSISRPSLHRSNGARLDEPAGICAVWRRNQLPCHQSRSGRQHRPPAVSFRVHNAGCV